MDHPISILDQNGLKCQHSNTHPYDWNGVVFLFYHRIRELREDSDQTQAQIAQALGLSQRAYSYYETGARMIPPWVLSDLATLYGTSVDYILGRTDARCPYPTPDERL